MGKAGQEVKTKASPKLTPKAGKRRRRRRIQFGPKVGPKAWRKLRESGVASVLEEKRVAKVLVTILENGSRATLHAMLKKKVLASSVAPQLARTFTFTQT